MKKMNKALVTLVAAVTIASNVVGLASCGGGDKVDYSKEVPVVAYDGSAVTVTFQHTMGATLREVLNESIKSFNEIYPNIKIEPSCPTNDYDELRTLISTGLTATNSPHVAFCYPDHVALYNTTNAVVSLDGYINSELTVKDSTETMGLTAEQKADYIDAFYAEGSNYGNGKTYTLPFFKSTEVLYYNKTFFKAHAADGLEEPSDDWTWEDLWTACAKIKEIATANNDKKVIPLGYDSEANWFITMTEQMGTPYTSATGEKYLFNTKENRDFVADLRAKHQAGYFTTKALNGNTYTSDLFNQTKADQVKCYMCIGSTGGSSYQAPDPENGQDPFEVGVALMPQYNHEAPKAIQQGPSICLFKKSNPQEVAAAWLFAKYFTTSIDFQANVSMKNGYTPVIKSVLENPTYQEWLETASSTANADLQAKTVVKALAQKDYYYTSPAFNGSSAAREYVGALMQKCLSKAGVDIAAEFQSTIDTLKYKFSD